MTRKNKYNFNRSNKRKKGNSHFQSNTDTKQYPQNEFDYISFNDFFSDYCKSVNDKEYNINKFFERYNIKDDESQIKKIIAFAEYNDNKSNQNRREIFEDIRIVIFPIIFLLSLLVKDIVDKVLKFSIKSQANTDLLAYIVALIFAALLYIASHYIWSRFKNKKTKYRCLIIDLNDYLCQKPFIQQNVEYRKKKK